MIESILSKLSEVSERYVEIENLLSQPDITSNQENYIKLSKEYFSPNRFAIQVLTYPPAVAYGRSADLPS